MAMYGGPVKVRGPLPAGVKPPVNTGPGPKVKPVPGQVAETHPEAPLHNPDHGASMMGPQAGPPAISASTTYFDRLGLDNHRDFDLGY